MNCKCESYSALELSRGEISSRIKESILIERGMERLAKHPNGESELFKCPICSQLWQSSRAWNWGNKKYLFKVPPTNIEDWNTEPFASPDEMLIYSAVMREFVSKNKFVESENGCKSEGCPKKALDRLSHCLKHHFEQLSKVGLLPKPPVGKLFSPYFVETSESSN